MAARQRLGRVVTFYSYKGGVGRTMALANVAFLAASNGYRVLVMDWDLEAPGLHYYFRGLVDAPDARRLKETPGVLNMVWDWTASVKAATTAAETQKVFDRFDHPDFFEEHVSNVLKFGDDEGKVRGVLDYMNAGSPLIGRDDQIEYAEAVVQFSWPNFFADYAGGSVLESLRGWAKNNYDFVLIDSRTGLADVSGICTTQLPDAVALCFILNRQNIDGVARIASAVRTRRKDELGLHAVPMRVAMSGTGEEEDARARGIYELSRIGGFSEESVRDDFRLLSVRAADNVAYYETLSFVTAKDLATDPLTLNYMRLANRLLDVALEMPELSQAWIEMVHRRLQPRHATIEYVSKLMALDPLRAISELEMLLESAFETVVDGAELSDDYVTALVEAALYLASRSEGPYGAMDMLHRTLDLLRNLANANPDKWRSFLAAAIERHIETVSFYIDPEEELALLEELDGLLADSATVANRLRRLSRRRRAARLYLMQGDLDAATQTVGECMQLIKEINNSPKLAGDQGEELVVVEIEASLLRGEIAERRENWPKAFTEYMSGLSRLVGREGWENTELPRLAFDFHNRLSRTPRSILQIAFAADHAVAAAEIGGQNNPLTLVAQFAELAKIVIEAEDPSKVIRFCEGALDQDRRVLVQSANYWGRVPRSALQFFAISQALVEAMHGATPGSAQKALGSVAETAASVWRTLDRRRHTIGTKAQEGLLAPAKALEIALLKAGATEQAILPFSDAIRRRPPPSTPPPPTPLFGD